jgi:hypothetical protein
MWLVADEVPDLWGVKSLQWAFDLDGARMDVNAE